MKYVIYYRVSTKRQGESGLGLESQETYIKHFIDESQIVTSFTDVKSGKNISERPELLKAVALCKKEGYTLAVAKIDRLSRRTEDALFIFNELEERLFSCDIPSLDKFTLTLFMAIADRERVLIGIRTKAALQAKKERGEKLGQPKYMTAAGREKGRQRVQDKAAKNENNRRAIALICEYKAKGMTLEAIANELNKIGFKSSTGKAFHKTTVSRLYKRALKQGQ